LKKILQFLFLLLLGRNSAHASTVWNGKADTKWYKKSESEFIITTPQQLAGLAKLVNKGNDFRGKTIKLGANIMLNDTTNWQNWDKKSPRNKWKPIGFEKYKYYGAIGHVTLSNTTSNYFSGVFDGSGFAVSGVYVDSDEYAGLFGYIARGTIKNLGVTASYIKGGTYVGGLLGLHKYGQIINCYSSAWVKGGIYSGGLVGDIGDGKIIRSYFTGMVAGESIAGGLVGTILGEINSSYSASTVTGKYSAGGLAGSSVGKIINSYSISKVTGGSLIGGLVGRHSVGEISSSYSAGKVVGDSLAGGFAGLIGFKSSVINSYYDKEASGQSKGIGTYEGNSEINKNEAYSKITAELKQKVTFKEWDFDKIWHINDSINSGYPHLKTEP
jgi:hypothetical protein